MQSNPPRARYWEEGSPAQLKELRKRVDETERQLRDSFDAQAREAAEKAKA